ALVAGLVTGLYAAVWSGWIFTYLVVLCAALACLALTLLRQSAAAGLRSAWRAPEVRAIACAAVVYYLTSGIFASLTGTSAFFAPFVAAGSIERGAASSAGLWPVAFNAVSELGKPLP